MMTRILLTDMVQHDGISYSAGTEVEMDDRAAAELMFAGVARMAPMPSLALASADEVAALRAEVAMLRGPALPHTGQLPDLVATGPRPIADEARDNALIADAATEPSITPALRQEPDVVVVAADSPAEAAVIAEAVAGAEGAGRGGSRRLRG